MSSVTLHLDERVLAVVARVASIEELNALILGIENAARGLWPEVVFRGEADFDDDDEAEGGRRRPRGASNGLPKSGGGPAAPAGRVERAPEKRFVLTPGSFSERVLEAAKRLGPDVTAIADELDARSAPVGSSIRRLRDGGYL